MRGMILCLCALIAAQSLFSATAIRPFDTRQGFEFEQNLGQGPAGTRFLGRLGAARFLVRDAEIEFHGPAGDVVHWGWRNATRRTSWTGVEASGSATSYYLGSDSERWVRDAPGFRKIRREDLYPGIDWIAYGSGDRLEYDLILKAGADPRQIQLTVMGAAVRLGTDGELRVPLTGGELIQEAPIAYQMVDGCRRAVKSRFVSLAAGVFTLELDSYRRDLNVVVDPIVRAVFAASGNDEDRVVAVSESFVAGVTRSADWHRFGAGGSDVFIRYQTGNTVQTIFWGGSGDDEITAFSARSGVQEIALAGWTT